MSQRPSSRQATYGAIIVLLILTLAVVIFFLDAIERKVEGQFTVVAVLPQAHRIETGSEVWLGGAPAGRVVGVSLMSADSTGTARIAVTLDMSRAVRGLVRRDSRIRLSRPNPLAAPVLEVQPGSGTAPPLGPGDTLRPPRFTDVDQALASGRSISAGFDTLITQIDSVRILLRRRDHALHALRRDAGAASRTLDRLRATLPRGDIGRFAGDSVVGARAADAAANLSAIAAALRRRAAQLDTLAEHTPGAPDSAGADVASRLRALSRNLRTLDATLASGPGTLPRLRRDSTLLMAVDSLRRQLDALVRRSRFGLLRLLF